MGSVLSCKSVHAKPRISFQQTKATAAQSDQIMAAMEKHLLKFHRLEDKEISDYTSPPFLLRYRYGLQNDLLRTREAGLYFLMVGEHRFLDIDTSIIFQIEGEANAQVVAQAYNAAKPQSPPARIGDVVRATHVFPEMVKNLQRRIFQQLEASRDQQRQQATQDKKASESKFGSLKELIQDLDAPAVDIVSRHLIALLKSVDTSEKQTRRVSEALQDSDPQLRLLELAYVHKQHRELTQKEIQAAVYAGLDEATSPRMLEESIPEEGALETVERVERDDPTIVEVSARDSKSRIEKMKRDLQNSGSDFRLLIHNEKQFFDIFKPGTGRFEAVEKDIEILRQKFARVFGYFNGTQNVLQGDGHFSRTNHRIFDLKYGQYRLLIAKAKASEIPGVPRLIVLTIFHKKDADDQNKEDRFYNQANRILGQGGY